MKQQEVVDFFDSLAPEWDARQIRDTDKIRTILYLGGVRKGCDVLDVACGTGVLIPDYVSMGAGSITAIDISPEMVTIAKSKFYDKARFICGDAEKYDYGALYDCIIIYDASPHFPDLDHLIKHLTSYLRPGGKLTVAHSMGPLRLNCHHSGSAKRVSHVAYSAKELKEMFSHYLTVTAVVSDEDTYQVTGVLDI